MHDWHVAHGARFVNAGLWMRPHSYPRAGETDDDAANREARNVRTDVGMVDVSTLGKIEVQGRDVAEFLNRVYINRWDTLAVGRCRYGVMLREDGIVLDDGTTSRLADNALPDDDDHRQRGQGDAAARVAAAGATGRSCEVYATSVTEQWAAVALAGPSARDVLAGVVDIDVSNAGFPFLAVGDVPRAHRRGAGALPARLFRMSYSGELAYEIHVPADHGRAMWEAVMAAGEPFGHHAVRHRGDGRAAHREGPRGGRRRSRRAHHRRRPRHGQARQRRQVVHRQAAAATAGADGAGPLATRRPHRARRRTDARAAKLVADPDQPAPNPMLGHVTVWCWSPNLDAWIALALLADGRARHGETLWAVSPLVNARVRVRVGAPCFIDPDGERLRA